MALRKGGSATPPSATSKARERVLQTAYELFAHHGTRAVGVNAIVARSGTAKMTFYHHFPSKEALVLAFLGRREELWTRAWLAAEVRIRREDPAERLLAIFDVFHEWFQAADFEGCSFINVLLEVPDPADPVRRATVEHLANIRTFLQELAEATGVDDPDDFARKWHILMKGSIIAAGEGDKQAARRAQEIGRLLLAGERATSGLGEATA